MNTENPTTLPNEQKEAIPSNANTNCVGPSSSNAGKVNSCAGCPNQKSCASGKMKDQMSSAQQTQQEVLSHLSQVKNILLILSGKGGVGKSTISSQIAWTLAYYGFKIGILDIDICGPSIARMMGTEDAIVRKSQTGWEPVSPIGWEHNLSVMSVAYLLASKTNALIWRGPRKNGLIKQFLVDVLWDELDFLIIDSPPGTSDEHISIATLLKQMPNVYSVIVSTPQELSLLDVRKEISFAKKVQLNILGVIENMRGYQCPCCNHTSDIFLPTTGGAEKMCSEMNVRYLGSLPIDPLLLKCCENGCSFIQFLAQQKSNCNQSIENQTKEKLMSLISVILECISDELREQFIMNVEKYQKNGCLMEDESESESEGGNGNNVEMEMDGIETEIVKDSNTNVNL